MRTETSFARTIRFNEEVGRIVMEVAKKKKQSINRVVQDAVIDSLIRKARL
jgi:predicted HicB family RNase H-like nuclease